MCHSCIVLVTHSLHECNMTMKVYTSTEHLTIRHLIALHSHVVFVCVDVYLSPFNCCMGEVHFRGGLML